MGLTAQGYKQGFVSQLVKISGCYRAIIKNVIFLGFPGGSMVKNPVANARETDWIPDPGRSHGLRSN